MTKLKLIVGLAAILVAMAISAAPASAWFKSLNKGTQGQVKITGITVKVGGSEGYRVICEAKKGEWRLQSKGKFEERQKKGNQEKTTEGPHLYLQIKEWTNCTGTLGLHTELEGIVAKACEFQLEQPEKTVSKGTITIVTECVYKIAKPECEIKIFAAKEPEKVNYLLKEIVLKGSGKNIIAQAFSSSLQGEIKCAGGQFKGGQLEPQNGTEAIILEELELV
jgi:hypothetical protein